MVLEKETCVFFPYAETEGSFMAAERRHEYTQNIITPPTGYKVDVSPFQRRREDKGEMTFVPGIYVDYDLIEITNV